MWLKQNKKWQCDYVNFSTVFSFFLTILFRVSKRERERERKPLDYYYYYYFGVVIIFHLVNPIKKHACLFSNDTQTKTHQNQFTDCRSIIFILVFVFAVFLQKFKSLNRIRVTFLWQTEHDEWPTRK